MAYRLQQQKVLLGVACLSRGRTYIALPEDDGVSVLEATTGRILARLPSKERTEAVAFSDDGRRLAIVAGGQLLIYDTTAPASTKPEIAPAEGLTGWPGLSAPLAWVGDHYLASRTGLAFTLYSIRQQCCLWNYDFTPSYMGAVRGEGRVCEIMDQYLAYGGQQKEQRASKQTFGQKLVTVGTVRLPGPGVEEADAGLDPDSMMIVKPGAQVRLDVECGADSAHIQTALEAKIKANGWVWSSDAANVLTAKMDRGKQQNVTYHFFHGETQSASVIPYVSSLKMAVGTAEVWRADSASGAPLMVVLHKGETVQSEIDSRQKPDPGFFERVEIPAKIVDPAKRRGVGTTEIGAEGLAVRNSGGGKSGPGH